MKKIKIFSDGGSRNNPGQAAIGYVIYDDTGNLLEICGKKIGIATNNEAEYTALLEALNGLKKLLNGENTKIACFLDSQLVVNQINKTFKVKEKRLIPFLEKFREYEKEFGKISVNLIPREKNQEADRMVNQALDN